MRARLRYVFLTPSVHVKPAMSNVGADLFGWLTMNATIIEAFADDRRRYGLRIALFNFAHMVQARNRDYQRRLG